MRFKLCSRLSGERGGSGRVCQEVKEQLGLGVQPCPVHMLEQLSLRLGLDLPESP